MCGSFCEGCNFTRRRFLSAGACFALGVTGCSDIEQIGKNHKDKKRVETGKGSKEMDNLKFIAYCGLYCGLCAQRARIPRQANALRETMAKSGWDKWGTKISGFKEFWKFLTEHCDPDKNCLGCRQGGGCGSFCSIIKCAQKKKIDVCVFCEEFPCRRILGLARGYPTLIADTKRMKEIGVEAWIVEQEERAKTGFVYSDIRCHPYSVPRE